MNADFTSKGFLVRMFSVAMFVFLAVAGLGFVLYLFAIADSVYMFVLAASFAVLTLIAGFFNIFAALAYYRSYFYDRYLQKINAALKPVRRKPSVGVVMPVFNEDPELVKRNMLRLKDLKYPKNKIKFYLLDDSTDQDVVSALHEFSDANGITYMHRTDRKGYKAGALNHMLKNSNDELIAIFDYDEYLTNTNFLLDLIPYFNDSSMSYVQTEKSAFNGNFFANAVKLFDGFFFRFIQTARALNNTAIYAGSCGLIRRKAIDVIGGFPEYVIEDTFFSFESDRRHFKSLYVPKIYAYGKPITTFTALAKQQWRYNYGDTQFISYFFHFRKSMHGSPLSRMDYITHGFGLNYLSVVLILFTLVSVLIVFSSLPFLHITIRHFFNQTYIGLDLEILGILAFMSSLLAPIILAKIYFKSTSKGFMVFVLNFSLAVIRTKAAIAALRNKNPAFNWNRSTAQAKSHNLSFSLLNTRTELTLAVGLFSLGILSTFGFHNFAGGMWLIWYGIMYSATTVLFYRYG